MNRPPLAIGLLLCDLVIVDDKTRRVTPVNCFAKRKIAQPFPAEVEFYIVAGLVNGHGKGMGHVSIERLDTFGTLFERDFAINFEHPLQEFWMMAHVRRCCFPFPGAFQVALTIDSDVVAMRRFLILDMETSS